MTYNKISIIKLSKLNAINVIKGLLMGFILFFAGYTIVSFFTFDPTQVKFKNSTVKLYDENSEFLWELSKDNSVRNTPVSLNQVPDYCKKALISIEDKSFYNNIGVDINGLTRLTLSIFSNGSLGGGSTISQQVIKNYYNNIYNRDALDKFKEIIYAVRLNTYYSKDEILEMYLNNVFFGDLNYGIGSAAENYFNKSVDKLDLAECAYLAGIPQWPGIYNPKSNQEKGKNRQFQVLQAMTKDGYISSAERKQAYNQKLNFVLIETELRAPHFIQYVQEQNNLFLTDTIPEYTVLKTAYNYQLHKELLSILKNNINNFNLPRLNNGAIVVFRQNEIKVMIGSKDFFDDSINGKFNSALGLRQPGSALIPLFEEYTQTKITDSSIQIDLNSAIDFEKYLNSLSQENNKDKCTEKLLQEGCELSIFSLSSIYHNRLNGYSINSLPSNSQINNTPSQNLIRSFKNHSTEYAKYMILTGDTSNQKDAFAIATNGEYTIGVWIGNTQGEEIPELKSDSTAGKVAKDIIDYLTSNER